MVWWLDFWNRQMVFSFLLLSHMLSWHGQVHLYPHPKIQIKMLKPNFTCFVWTWNLVSYNKEKTLIDGVQEQVAEENMGEEVTGGWRKPHDEGWDVQDISWWPALRTGLWLENLYWRDHLGHQIIDGRIILKWKMKIQDIGTWTNLSEL